MEIVNLNFSPDSGGWITSLMTKVRQGDNQAMQERFDRWGERKISDHAMSLVTKMMVIDVAANRLDRNVRTFLREVTKVPFMEIERRIEMITDVPLAPEQRSYVLELPFKAAGNDEMIYGLIFDIDAFIFEARVVSVKWWKSVASPPTTFIIP